MNPEEGEKDRAEAQARAEGKTPVKKTKKEKVEDGI